MRACSWAVREAHGPFEGCRHTPAARSSRWVSYTTSGMSLPSSRETVSTCEGTGGASVGARRTGRRGASARHSAVRWVCRHGVALGERGSRPAASACLTRSLQASQERGGKKRTKASQERGGKKRTKPAENLARRHSHHASGSFICRESFSVYSRGMATMATMATPKLKLEKKMDVKPLLFSQTGRELPSRQNL
jgi:hypothetical protein